MIKIINEDTVVVYDEIGWGDTVFHTTDILKDLIANHINLIYSIEFMSIERVIVIRIDSKSGYPLEIDYWFRDIDPDLLNFLCQNPKLRAPVKRFFIRGRFPSFSVEKYPLLAATLLGNNNES